MTPNRIVAFILTVSVTVPTLAEVSPAVLQAEQDRAALVETVRRDQHSRTAAATVTPENADDRRRDLFDQCRPVLFGL